MAVRLRLERLLQVALGPGDAGGVVDRRPGAVGGALELGEQVADEDGVAVVVRVAPVQGVLGALADDGCGGMCPPVSPKTPLFRRMQVTASPRAAVCSTSWSPSFTMSPSPCNVNTTESGSIRFTPVATDGARPWSACTRSTSIELLKLV